MICSIIRIKTGIFISPNLPPHASRSNSIRRRWNGYELEGVSVWWTRVIRRAPNEQHHLEIHLTHTLPNRLAHLAPDRQKLENIFILKLKTI